MVGAHGYDVDAAREVGMGTCYVRRDTEDSNFSAKGFDALWGE